MRRWMLGLAVVMAMGGGAQAQAPVQADLDRLAADLGYRFAILDNRPAACPGAGACFVSEITITTPRHLPPALAAAGITIGYSFVAPVRVVESDMFANRTIQGDVNQLSLKPGRLLAAGRTYRIRVIGDGHVYSRGHAMPNARIMAPGLMPRVIAATRPGTDRDTGLETLPFMAPMIDEAKLATAKPEDRTVWRTPERAFALYAERGRATAVDVAILPAPALATRPAGKGVDLSQGVRVTTAGVDPAMIAPALAALDATPGPVLLSIAVVPGMAAEGYRLTIADGAIAIRAADAAGASHALRSLAQQRGHEGPRLRALVVEDAPRLAFRGLHIDVARNFHGKAELLKLVEQMAAYKLNALHLHLADDEGWRLAIAALPELTAIGGYRCADADETRCLSPQLGADPDPAAPTNGYLTAADYADILRAARARQIAVMPSFDMPGHSRAAIRAMEVRYRRLLAAGDREGADRYRLVDPGDTTRYRSVQYYDDNTLNPCLDATYRFLDTVIEAVAAIHETAGVPLATYHIGADETAGAWTRSPACRAMTARTGTTVPQLGAMFVERVAGDLARRGIRVAGWSDGLGHADPRKMPKAVQTNIWGTVHGGGPAEAHAQANRGWQVVLSMPDAGYFDMPYAADPEEPGYDWATRGVDSFQAFAFMPGNLPANAALIPTTLNQPAPLADTVPLDPGRAVTGLQAQLWSETVRRDTQVEYMLFPRLLALAERGWSKAAWEPAYVAGASYAPDDPRVDRPALLAGWRDFAGRTGVALRALDMAGVTYRLAPPGARIVAGQLEANAEFPGLAIEYRDRTGGWRRYAGPVAVKGAVTVRTRSPNGRRAGRSVVVGG